MVGFVAAVLVLLALAIGFMWGRGDAWMGDQVTLASALHRGKRIRSWVELVARGLAGRDDCERDCIQLVEELELLETRRRQYARRHGREGKAC